VNKVDTKNCVRKKIWVD